MMNARKLIGLAALAMLPVMVHIAPVQAAVLPFTYQGQIKFDGVPVNGAANFLFDLYDADRGGNLLDSDEFIGVWVTNGLFAVDLAFERAEFNGDPRWLEITVRTADGEAVLAPRQAIYPVPLALTALETVGVDGHSLDAVDGSPTDAVYVGADGKVNLNRSGLSVYDAMGQGITLTSGRFAFSEMPSEDPVYAYTSATQTHTFYTDGVSRLEIDPLGNVGIGVSRPTDKLQVEGTVGMTGFRLGTGPVAGYVLTSDSLGNGTWQQSAGGGDSLWTEGRDLIYYNGGPVGIGTTDPQSLLDVIGGISMDGFRLRASRITAGHVLTTDANGVGTWQAIPQTSDPLWGHVGSDIYYDAGRVGVGTQAPSYPLHVVSGVGAAVVGQCPAESTHGELGSEWGGVHGESSANGGIGVHGQATMETGTNYGVYGETSSSAGFGGYFLGQGYFSGNVGIGVASPTTKLDVSGTVKMTGLKLGNSATAGHVLTTDANGVGTWQAPTGGGESLWSQSGSNVYYNDGNVGIATSTPSHQLTIEGPSMDKIRLFRTQNATGYGSRINFGDGNYAYIQEDQDNSLLIHASGRTNFDSGYVGIGVAAPDSRLHVNGTVHASGFRLGTSATAGYVLTADANGQGTWQASTGGGSFDLPFDGTVDADGDGALTVTNTGSGPGTSAISAVINNSASQETAAGVFRAHGSGSAIQATSDTDTTIYASGDGQVIYATTSGGSGAGEFRSSANGGFGVYGRSSSTGTSSENRGGRFEASGPNGRGVYARTTGAYGRAVEAIAEGGEGIGVWTEAPWDGVVAKGGRNAALFYGDIRVYTYGTNNQVFRVNDSTGTTTVKVLQIEGGADLAEPFDVTDGADKAEPGMLVSIDPENVGKLVVSNSAYDFKVAGVISGAGGIQPGMVMGQEGSIAHGDHPVALTGRVWTFCDASDGAIEPGDLLTTSQTPGHAMKVMDVTRAQGAIIGKAMSRLAKGERGLVLVLVNLQ